MVRDETFTLGEAERMADTGQELARAGEVQLAQQGAFMGEWLSAGQVLARKKVIGSITSAIMEKDVHYGTFSGSKKPCLLKPGAEALATTFAIGPKYAVEDCSEFPHLIRYRVACSGYAQGSEVFLGQGIGECSSEEDSKKWRKVRLWEEYDASVDDQRREVFTRDRVGGKAEGAPVLERQVRQYPPDVANAVLKIAKKRAYVDMVLTVTGASDFFEQDTEDDAGGAAVAKDDVRKAEARGQAAPVKTKLPGAFLAKGAVEVPAAAGTAAAKPTSSPNVEPAAAIELATPEDEAKVLELLDGIHAPANALELILAAQGVSTLSQMTKEKIKALTHQLSVRLDQVYDNMEKADREDPMNKNGEGQ